MYLSSILSPSLPQCEAFAERNEHFMWSLAAAIADACTEGNRIIIDADRKLVRDLGGLRDLLPFCTPEERKSLALLLATIGNQQSPLVFPVTVSNPPSDSMQLAEEVAKINCGDGVIVDRQNLNRFADAGLDGSQLHEVDTWRNSKFTTDNESFKIAQPRTTDVEIGTKLIGSMLRLSSSVQLYDKMIGRATQRNAIQCCDSILYLLDTWDKYGIVAEADRRLEIITMLQYKDYPRQKRHLHDKNYNALLTLEQDIVEYLQDRWSGSIEAFIVKDVDSQLFHARWLRTHRAIVRFDSGFDFVRKVSGNISFTEGLRISRDPHARDDLNTIDDRRRSIRTHGADWYDKRYPES